MAPYVSLMAYTDEGGLHIAHIDGRLCWLAAMKGNVFSGDAGRRGGGSAAPVTRGSIITPKPGMRFVLTDASAITGSRFLAWHHVSSTCSAARTVGVVSGYSTCGNPAPLLISSIVPNGVAFRPRLAAPYHLRPTPALPRSLEV